MAPRILVWFVIFLTIIIATVGYLYQSYHLLLAPVLLIASGITFLVGINTWENQMRHKSPKKSHSLNKAGPSTSSGGSLMRRIDKTKENTETDDNEDLFGDFDFDDDEPDFGPANPPTTKDDNDEQKESASKRLIRPVRRLKRPSANNPFANLFDRLLAAVIAEVGNPGPNLLPLEKQELRQKIEEVYRNFFAENSLILSRAEKIRLFETIAAEIVGYGPLDVLLADNSVSQIYVNGPKNVFVVRKGLITRTNLAFIDDGYVIKHLRRMLGSIEDDTRPLPKIAQTAIKRVEVVEIKERVERTTERTTGSLLDRIEKSGVDPTTATSDDKVQTTTKQKLIQTTYGVTSVLRPVSLTGPSLTISRNDTQDYALTVHEFVRFGILTPNVAQFLQACVLARINILVCGGVRSDKHELANILYSFLPENRRLVMIEKVAQLDIQHANTISIQALPPGEFDPQSSEMLLQTALQLEPDVLGFDRDTGCEITYFHEVAQQFDGQIIGVMDSGKPHDAIERLEMSALNYIEDQTSFAALKGRIADRLQLIIQMEALRDGSRKVKSIVEATHNKTGNIDLDEIYVFEQTGLEGGKIIGRIRPTGTIPKCLERIRASGITISDELFGSVR